MNIDLLGLDICYLVSCICILHPQHTYAEIIAWWDKLATDNADLVVYHESIGKSKEGRDQPAIHITSNEDPNVKTIYFQCQIHASMFVMIVAL